MAKTGMEMAVEALLKYAGINPAALIEETRQTVQQFQTGLQLVATRLDNIDARQKAIMEQLGVADPVKLGDTQQPQQLRLVGNTE